ncbi:MAG: sigma-70 family RNA polymerase sigma factor [Magnetospirillum sp.]|nr:sigma-70 family RNA polymerase sigma factor [Magnetospirillum sp.]
MNANRSPSDLPAAYARALRAAPLIEGAEEAELVGRWREGGDTAARDRLVVAHLRLVVKMATQFRGYGMAFDDLVAEGNLGLVRALDTFEPERGLRFSTYAQWWVRAAMFEHVLKFSTPVAFGLSAERKRLFFKLKGIKARLTGPEGGSLTPAEATAVAGKLGVSERQVVEMERLLGQSPLSLDAPIGESGSTFGEVLPDERPDAEAVLGEHQELMYRRDLLKSAWTGLSERERDIIAARTLRERPLRLEDLAQRWGISRERVRQIEVAAISKLRGLMAMPRLSHR